MIETENCYVESKHGMGTFLRIMNFAGEICPSFIPIWEIFEKIEFLCSRFNKNSQLSLINKMAGKKQVYADESLIKILRAAQYMADFTDGAFDATIGAATQLCSFRDGITKIPDEAEWKNAAALVNYHMLKINGDKVFLEKENMKLDLGGIAKEFALHAAAEKAAQIGIEAAIIDAGGDVCTVGAKPNNRPWRIGIQHPRQSKSLLASVVLQKWNTVETSGDYRRFARDGDKVYSHILSFRQEAASDKLISATLVYQRRRELLPINGTALIASGFGKSKTLLKQLPDVEAILVTDAMQVFITEGLRGYVHILPHQMREQTYILNRRAC